MVSLQTSGAEREGKKGGREGRPFTLAAGGREGGRDTPFSHLLQLRFSQETSAVVVTLQTSGAKRGTSSLILRARVCATGQEDLGRGGGREGGKEGLAQARKIE